MRALLILCSVLLVMNSCSDDALSVDEQFALDTSLIEEYLRVNNITAQKTVDGIYYTIENEGSAEKPKITSDVTVKYKGYFLDKKVFDANDKTTFPLYGVIQGWQKGIPKFGRAGKGSLYIPSKYGYGARSIDGRTNAVLAFDIEVFDF